MAAMAMINVLLSYISYSCCDRLCKESNDDDSGFGKMGFYR